MEKKEKNDPREVLITIFIVGVYSLWVIMKGIEDNFILTIITLLAGNAIIIAGYIVISMGRLKLTNFNFSSENEKFSERFKEIMRFIGIGPITILILVVVAVFLIIIVWIQCYDNIIETPEPLINWLNNLLNYQFGLLALFISLSIVVIKLSSSAFSVRILNPSFGLIYGKKDFLLLGLGIFSVAIVEIFSILWAESFDVIKLPDLLKFMGGCVIPLVLILCVISFGALCLCSLYIFIITQSDHVIKMSLANISSDNSKSSNGKNNSNSSKNENNNKINLQLIFNVINSSIQQSDTLSSKNGIERLSQKMNNMLANSDFTGDSIKEMGNSDFIKDSIKEMANSAKGALLQGDEKTAIYIIKSINKNVVEKIGKGDSPDDEKLRRIPREGLLPHIKLIIDSYSSLSQFSIERGYTDSASKCIKSLELCNEKLFECYISADLTSANRDTNPKSGNQDRNMDNNPYDLSVKCIKSISIVSQIAAQKNYENFVRFTAETMSLMCTSLFNYLKTQPTQVGNRIKYLPINRVCPTSNS
ncbi:MAG: hypothetical protein KAW93_01360, partial [Methanogenium sp.]|nr:hypothetical protein [Methanogenium sp.]